MLGIYLFFLPQPGFTGVCRGVEELMVKKMVKDVVYTSGLYTVTLGTNFSRF